MRFIEIKLISCLILLMCVVFPAQAYSPLGSYDIQQAESLPMRFGSINIFSEITGVEIFIDGEFNGMDVVKKEKIQVGTHLIRAVKDNITFYNDIVEIGDGAVSTVNIMPRSSPGIGSRINVTKSPLGNGNDPHDNLIHFLVGYVSQNLNIYGLSGTATGYNIQARLAQYNSNLLYTYGGLEFTRTNAYSVPYNYFSIGIGLLGLSPNSNNIYAGVGILLGSTFYENKIGTRTISVNGFGPGFEVFLGTSYKRITFNAKYSYLSLNGNVNDSGNNAINYVDLNASNVSLNLGIKL